MRVRGQAPAVQTPGPSAAKVFPIKQDFPEWKQLFLVYHPVLWGLGDLGLPVQSLPCEALQQAQYRAQAGSSRNSISWEMEGTPSLQEARGQQSPLAAGVLLPRKGWTGLFWLLQQQYLLFLRPGCSAVSCSFQLLCGYRAPVEAASPSFQAAGAVEGGERKEGVGWGVEKRLLSINSSRLGLLASHAVNPFQPLQL